MPARACDPAVPTCFRFSVLTRMLKCCTPDFTPLQQDSFLPQQQRDEANISPLHLHIFSPSRIRLKFRPFPFCRLWLLFRSSGGCCGCSSVWCASLSLKINKALSVCLGSDSLTRFVPQCSSAPLGRVAACCTAQAVRGLKLPTRFMPVSGSSLSLRCPSHNMGFFNRISVPHPYLQNGCSTLDQS